MNPVRQSEVPQNVEDFIKLLITRGLLSEDGEFLIVFPVMYKYIDEICKYALAFPHERRNLFFTSEEAAMNYIHLAKLAAFVGVNNSTIKIEPPDFGKCGWKIFKRTLTL